MNEFVSDNKDYLPKGWDQRLTSVGDTTDLKAGSAGAAAKTAASDRVTGTYAPPMTRSWPRV